MKSRLLTAMLFPVVGSLLFMPGTRLGGATAEPAPTESPTSAPPAEPNPIEAQDVHSATVMGLDGTQIDMIVGNDGQAVTVATQDPTLAKKHKHKKHPLVGDNPADEPLSAGLVNESNPPMVEDAQPQVSDDLPR